ncbi:helix-turn-helix domain-containing protein [Clostridium cadaveris]|uniref:DNA-binding protein n=1 Tax=Clostridium cadaveris TaxID=1529 RepID=A0A316M2L7_9CLOT|nr:helix-turn-helix domain-containing protein [Clostridium cadaveris]MDM8310770.1 helix-turn-helix domain-containing protein [Clostridium cadaveris]MDU4951327.1 helix-turn-helix domain-containing protein [Clostridium sp.]NME63829.1 helix-turn-helix domain-containing protein [Clostridium cadaveris]PWL51818.1 MAG: DNA-binding protein [Clostridium cadaveris]
MELYTVVEVAQKLRTTKQRVYQLIRHGYIKALKLGDLKIPSYELERFIRDSLEKDFSDLDNVTDLFI